MIPSPRLDGKKGLIVGIANDQSLAWGCAQAMRAAGADLALTWQGGRTLDFVRPLFEQVGAAIALPLDVADDGQMQAVFDAIAERWGRLDFIVHAVAFAPRQDLHGRVVDSSRDGFATAMDVSCHSFVRMARHAEPLMTDGGSLTTMSYLGASEVVPGYGLMGPVKAALEATVRYLAVELGPAGIRVNTVSPGAIATRAASGLGQFDQLLQDSLRRSPLPRPFTAQDVGALCAFLASDAARAITGGTHYVDGGFNLLN